MLPLILPGMPYNGSAVLQSAWHCRGPCQTNPKGKKITNKPETTKRNQVIATNQKSERQQN